MSQPSWGAKRCPSCDVPVLHNQAICVECGTRLIPRQARIRCRYCGKSTSAEHIICPGCGREILPAPSRWLTIFAPVVFVSILIAVLVLRGDTAGLLTVLGRDGRAGIPLLENVVVTPVPASQADGATTDRLAPAGLAASASSGPDAATGTETDAATADAATTDAATTDAADAKQAPTGTVTANATVLADATKAKQELVADDPAQQATETPAAESETADQAQESLTATPIPSITATEEQDATRTATSTPPKEDTGAAGQAIRPNSYQVQQGDTPASIAARFSITVSELLSANRLSASDALNLKPGQTLQIPGGGDSGPGPTASPVNGARYVVQAGDTIVGIAQRFRLDVDLLMEANGLTASDAGSLQVGQTMILPGVAEAAVRPPTATATPTPNVRRYTIRPGDTIIGIASRFQISSVQLLAANGLTEADARSLRPGDQLLIPQPNQVFPTATSRPRPSSTPTPTATATESSLRLDPPKLLDPVAGINVTCNEQVDQYMRWESVAGIRAEDDYVLFLGFVSGAAEGDEEPPVEWIIEQRMDNRTTWRMDRGYCDLAPQNFGRRWRWYVQIFAGDAAVSEKSEVREFSWR